MNALHDLLHAFLVRNDGFLFALAAGSIAILAVGLLVARFAPRTSAATRHTIIVATLAAPLVLMAATVIGLRVTLPVRPPGGTIQTTVGAAAAPAVADGALSELACALALLWLGGLAVALLRIGAQGMRWRSVGRRAMPVTDLRVLRLFGGAGATLESSPEIAEPLVIGLFGARVLIPAGSYAEELDDAELASVLTHELAHVVRRDNAVSLLVQLASAPFWFDPLHRLARRRVVELRERACDAVVLEEGCDATAYAAALARSCQTTFPSSAVSCMSGLQLHERMESIMTHDRRPAAPSWLVRTALLAVLGVAGIAFASITPAPSMPGEETGTYDFDVRAMRAPSGGYLLLVNVRAQEGGFTLTSEVPSAPDVRSIISAHGGRTYKIVTRLAADGSVLADLEVKKDDEVISYETRSFGPPETRKLASTTPGYERVGGAVKAPKIITRVEPAYSEEARKERIAGIVILEVLISESGAVNDVKILKPLPFGLADAAAEAVRQWRFEPGTIDGKPVPVAFNLTINFRLEEEQ